MASPTRPLVAAIARGELHRVRPLLEEGVELNATWEDGETALMIAAGSGHEEVVDMLLAAGADAAARDDWGRTACIWAAEVHNVRLAERLWQAQVGRLPSELTRHDLSPGRLDGIETPLTTPEKYLVLYEMHYHPAGVGRFFALGAAADRDAALELISRDNNRAVETGPYLLCRRLRLPEETRTRATNPLATSLESYRLSAPQLLVLAHLPTITTNPGRLISRQQERPYRGWVVIAGAFSQEDEAEAREAALAAPGRVSLVQLLQVCTCYEGWVEGREALVKTPEELRATGEARRIEPLVTRGSEAAGQAPPQSEATDPSSVHQRPILTGHDFYIKRGFELFREFPLGFSAFSLVTLVLALAFGLMGQGVPLGWVIACSAMVLGPLGAGFFQVSLAVAGGRVARWGDFVRVYRYVVPMLGLAVLAWGLGLATVFVPPVGLVAAYVAISSMYAVPLIVDRGLGLLPALAESWRMTHRRFLDSVAQSMVIALVALAGVALLGLGVLVSLPWAGCILTAAYRDR